jgi:hypothetical protein
LPTFPFLVFLIRYSISSSPSLTLSHPSLSPLFVSYSPCSPYFCPDLQNCAFRMESRVCRYWENCEYLQPEDMNNYLFSLLWPYFRGKAESGGFTRIDGFYLVPERHLL